MSYIDLDKDTISVSTLKLSYSSKEFLNLFYDSLIMKSEHTLSMDKNGDILYFEILLQYFDEVVTLKFLGVTNIESESTLSYFPEIRTIELIKSKSDSTLKATFNPMWSTKKIKFNFNSLEMQKHLISKKNLKIKH